MKRDRLGGHRHSAGMKATTDAFGLIIIGDEILDGRRQDKHMAYAIELMQEHHLKLAWIQVIADEAPLIESTLAWAFAQPRPFFSCGGIGSTPDDRTRGCAARVLGLELEYHPDGAEIIKDRFEGGATPHRLEMINFPAGAALVPNPVNRVPGFSINNGYFLPGFPSMAHPMMRWVVETCYACGPERTRYALMLPKAKEADLVYLMEAFILGHPQLGFSSLPKFSKQGPCVELGISGTPEQVATGAEELRAALQADGIEWEGVGKG
jgi:molybdopterin-biosynthesis enzyme MoeA-like protein